MSKLPCSPRRYLAGGALAVLVVADATAMAGSDLPQRLVARLGWVATLQLDELMILSTLLLAGAWLLLRWRQPGEQALAAADQEREERAMRHLALRDPLTELLNRRGLEDSFARAVPNGRSRAILLCDLDGFKHVNDTLGHAAGDEILRRFAACLRELQVAGAALASVRLGGDEFVLLVTAADAAEVARRAAGLIAGVTDQVDGEWPVTVSIGIAPADRDARLDDVLMAADRAMYDAKRSGDVFRVFEAGQDTAQRSQRRIFERQLAAGGPWGDRHLFVVVIAIEGYRGVRRTYGNGACGKLIREVQRRLEQGDTVAVERMAPDTLAVLIAAPDAAAAVSSFERLRAGMPALLEMGGLKVEVTLTAGLAGPSDPAAMRHHVELAQSALDEALRTGEPLVVQDAARAAAAKVNRALMAELHDAVAADELDVHYQPKLCSRTGQVDSLEALVRWPHPQRGMIAPGRFVSVAEETGNIRVLTDWVVDRVLADEARLTAAGLARPIYVNLSAQLVGEADFIEGLLRRIGSRSSAIGIEITETAVLSNPERALRHLHDLAAAGISIAIDDYGIGLSSLAYLKQLPARELKIDMMFITDLAESHRDPMIVRSTIDLAHGLGLRVTAEGVSNPMAMGLLRVMGCDLLQGFEISEPLGLDALIGFLRSLQHGDTASGRRVARQPPSFAAA